MARQKLNTITFLRASQVFDVIETISSASNEALISAQIKMIKEKVLQLKGTAKT